MPQQPDTAQQCIRDGDFPLVYIAGDGGLYKLFYQTGRIELMLPVGVGEQGHAVGYAGLSGPPQVTGTILVPTRNTTPGGLWAITAQGATLFPGGVGGLPVGFTWTAVAASPLNRNHLLMWGSTDYVGSTSGVIKDHSTQLSPLWQSLSGGTTWAPVTVPAPYYYIDLESKVRVQPPQIVYASDGSLLIAAAVNGIGNFFGDAEPGLALWRGAAGALTVLGASPSGLPLGDTTNVALYDLAAGQNGDAVLSAKFGTRSGHPGHELAYVTANATAATYPGDINVELVIDRVPGSPAIVGLNPADSSIWYTPNYQSAISQALAGPAAFGAVRAIAAAADGAYIANTAGIWRITGLGGTPMLSLSQSATTSGSWVTCLAAAKQGQGRAVAGRVAHSDATEGNNQSKFWLYNGKTWLLIDGPTAPDARNINLQLATIEVVE